VLAIATCFAYPPSFGRSRKEQEGQGRLGGEVGGGGGGFLKKGKEALSAQHAIEEVRCYYLSFLFHLSFMQQN
jgi:hypothetical protein